MNEDDIIDISVFFLQSGSGGRMSVAMVNVLLSMCVVTWGLDGSAGESMMADGTRIESKGSANVSMMTDGTESADVFVKRVASKETG